MKKLIQLAILLAALPVALGAQTAFSPTTTSASFSPPSFPAVNRHCCSDNWKNIESSRGTYTWTAFDAWQSQTAAHAGSKNMYTLSQVPTWANGTSDTVAPPTDINTSATCQAPLATTTTTDCQYKEFVTSLMQHACGVTSAPGTPLTGTCNLSYVEMWNEFNATNYWTGTATQLAQMSLDAAAIIRTYCGDCSIVGGSVSAGGSGGGGSISGYYDVALLSYLTAWGGLSGFVKPDYVSIHPYPSRDNVTPVPFPMSIVSNSSATCTSGNTPNASCYVPVYQEVTQVKGSAVLANSAISSWASSIPVLGTEGGWGETANVCNGSTCTATDANVIFLREAYTSEWMIAMWAQGTPQQLWYAYNDQCWGTLYGTGATESACPSNPVVPLGSAPWYQGWTQTAVWLASCSAPGSWTETAVAGGNTWTLPMTCSGRAAQIAFFDGWLTSYTASTAYANYTTLDGVVHATAGAVPLNQEPVLLSNPSVASGTNVGPLNSPQINSTLFVGSMSGSGPQFYSTIQSTVTAACASGGNRVVDIPPAYTGSDTIAAVTGGCTAAPIRDEHNGLPVVCYTWQTSVYSSSGVTCAGGAGTSVTVDGGPTLSSLALNGSSPSPDSDYIADPFKISGGDAIVETPYGSGSVFGVLEGDNSTLSISGGVISCTAATTSQLGCVEPDGTTTTISGGKLTAIGAAPSGAAGGDLSGTFPNPSVAKVNGAAVPASAAYLGTNGGSQPVSVNAPTDFTWNVEAGTTTSTAIESLYAAHAGAIVGCYVAITTTDSSTVMAFDIKQNGASVFTSSPSVAASSTGHTAYSLTSGSLSVAQYDVFTLSFSTIGAAWFAQITCHS